MPCHSHHERWFTHWAKTKKKYVIEHFKDFNFLQTWQRKQLSDVTHTPFTTLQQKLQVLQKSVYCCKTTKPVTFFLINFSWFVLPSSTVITRKHSCSMRTTRFCSPGVGFTLIISYLLATPQISYCYGTRGTLHPPTPTPVTEWLTFPQLLLRVVTIEHILPKKLTHHNILQNFGKASTPLCY